MWQDIKNNDSEDGGSVFLRNDGISPYNYTVLQPRNDTINTALKTLKLT